MGVVYRALDTHLDRTVAIKVLPREAVADPVRRQRFVQEARAASALEHANIVTIHDVAEAGRALHRDAGKAAALRGEKPPSLPTSIRSPARTLSRWNTG